MKKLQMVFQDLPFGKKMILFSLLVVSIAGVILTVVWARRPDYQIIYSNISFEDSAEIVTRLKQQRIPYRISANGRELMVPSKDIYEIRMQMASEGFPQGGNFGYELFDRTTFGTSEFVQKLNFRRALQGELSRTINQLARVEYSRVHIVAPEKTLFIEDQKKTTASVMLKLKGAGGLKQSQVRGIVHLVASSVEGLEPENITIIDVNGEILYGGQPASPAARLSTTQLEYRQNLERGIEQMLQSMLGKVVGQDSVLVRVTSEVDFKQVERTEENFNPDSQVARSEQRTEESSVGGGGIPAGIAGVEANIPGGPGAVVEGGGSQSQRTKETINYEINKVVQHIIEQTGKIKRLSVAVVIDGTYEGEGEKKTYKSRTPEEMKIYEDIVKTAAGYDETRGDKVKIENVQFKIISMEEEEAELANEAKTEQWMTIGRYAAAVIIALILVIYIIKPLLKWVTEMKIVPEGVPVGPMGETGASIGEEEENSEMAIKTKNEYRKKVQEIASSDPERTAELVRRWLKEGR